MDTARAKFMSKTKSCANGCIEWTGARTGPAGAKWAYGTLGIAGKRWTAHRAAWFFFKGSNPADMCVCHSCDNPLCVNVEHLFLGTHTENMRDMEQKGRDNHATGEAHWGAKLTQAQVNEIRRRFKPRGGAALAREFGVSKTTVSRIVRGRSWSPHGSGL